ncbi:hypothetical protein ABK040_003649 [Willaertia magna]
MSVSKSEIAFIILQYLQAENYTESFKVFKKESESLLNDFDTKSSLKGLQHILDEYIALSQLQQQNYYKQLIAQSICKDDKKQQVVTNVLHSVCNLLELFSLELVSNPITTINKPIMYNNNYLPNRQNIPPFPNVNTAVSFPINQIANNNNTIPNNTVNKNTNNTNSNNNNNNNNKETKKKQNKKKTKKSTKNTTSTSCAPIIITEEASKENLPSSNSVNTNVTSSPKTPKTKKIKKLKRNVETINVENIPTIISETLEENLTKQSTEINSIHSFDNNNTNISSIDTFLYDDLLIGSPNFLSPSFLNLKTPLKLPTASSQTTTVGKRKRLLDEQVEGTSVCINLFKEKFSPSDGQVKLGVDEAISQAQTEDVDAFLSTLNYN